ncbi:MAG TPA: BBP7 family outer membrane beta-barrel protein [Gemmataceae bacterium]|nr:BBP7 family outer membrane beta-barrel protein [Gemmataceae bacterium]
MVRFWPPLFLFIALSASVARGQAPKSTYTPVHQADDPHAANLVADSALDPVAAPVEQVLPRPPAAIYHADEPTGQFWLRADYLAWRLSGPRLPPLVTASPSGTARADAGVLGAPGTVVLVGDETVNDDFRSGARIRVGGWLDECRTIGFEVSGLVLDRHAEHFLAGSADGSLVVGRPFVDARTGLGNAELVSFPGVLGGTVAVDADSSKFWAANAVCRKSLCRDCTGYIDVVAGYRYLQFGDGLRVVEQLQPLPPAFPAGSQITVVDEFNPSNRFNGGVVGLVAGYSAGAWFVDAQARVAVGQTSSTVSVAGATRLNITGIESTTAAGGLLAQRTNIGSFHSSDWTVVPDFELAVGCWLNRCSRVFVGYSALYWPRITRAGDQIDLVVNPTQLPPGTLVGPARPAFNLSRSDLWAHGLSIGVEFRY